MFKKNLLMLTVFMFILSVSVMANGQEEMMEEGRKVVRFQSWIVTEMPSAMEELEKRFEEKYPDIDVQMEAIPFAEVKRQTIVSISAGNPPDVINMVANEAPQIAAMDALIDLNEYFTKEELADIPENALDDCIIEGKLTSIPNFLGTINVIAWKPILEEAGLPVAIPETWEEFKAAVETISALGPDTYGFGARTSKTTNSAFWFFPVLWGHLGTFEDEDGNIVFNDDGTIDALNWYKELGQNEQTPLGEGLREVRELMAQGKVGFIFDGPWMQGWFEQLGGDKLSDKYIAGKMPIAADGNRYGIANNHVMAVPRQSDVKEEAVKFIKFFIQDEGMNKIFHNEFGFIPISRSITDSTEYRNDSFFGPFIEAADYSVAVPSKHPQFLGALEFVAYAMQNALFGEDPEKTAKEARQNILTVYGQ